MLALAPYLIHGPAGKFNTRSFMMKFFSNRAADVMVFLLLSAAVFAQHYTQVNLDANVSGAAEAADSQLVNAWGLARSSGTNWWVSDEATGVATLYEVQ